MAGGEHEVMYRQRTSHRDIQPLCLNNKTLNAQMQRASIHKMQLGGGNGAHPVRGLRCWHCMLRKLKCKAFLVMVAAYKRLLALPSSCFSHWQVHASNCRRAYTVCSTHTVKLGHSGATTRVHVKH